MESRSAVRFDEFCCVWIVNANPAQDGITMALNADFNGRNGEVFCKALGANLVMALMQIGIKGKESAHCLRNGAISLLFREIRQPIYVMTNLVSERARGALLKAGIRIYQDRWPLFVIDRVKLLLRQAPLSREQGIHFPPAINVIASKVG
jgi:hypothetical protein